MNIMVINGPNLNLLGIREPEIYGRETYDDLTRYIKKSAQELDVTVDVRQSNHEGGIVTWIQACLGAQDAIIINPAAYTHTSIAILDALKAVNLPAVEVHLSDVNEREDFRRVSYSAMACQKVIAGYGFAGYRMAMEFLAELLSC